MFTKLVAAEVAVWFLSRFGTISDELFKQVSVVVVVSLTSQAIWRVFLYPKFVSPYTKLPQAPRGNFIMGQLLNIISAMPGPMMRQWTNEVPNEGVIRYLDVFNTERLLVVSPAALSEVLVQKPYEFIKPPELSAELHRILGSGLLFAEGDVHKKQRKNLMPAFAFRHVKDLYPLFWSKSCELVQQLHHDTTKPTLHLTPDNPPDKNSQKPNTAIDVNDYSSRATFDIVGLAAMGSDFNSISQPFNDLYSSYRQLFKAPKFNPFLLFVAILMPRWVLYSLPMESVQSNNRAIATIRGHCLDLVLAKKQQKKENPKTQKTDILDVALDSGFFRDEELVDHLMTFLAAGHETTASALTWVVYLMCKNPEVQKQLRAELRAHLPNPLDKSQSSPDVSMSHTELDNLPFLTAVCNEALRLYSPVIFTMRQAAVDTTIAGLAIPKGTTIVLSPWAVNASKALWGEDAEEFRPERWLSQSQSQRQNSPPIETSQASLPAEKAGQCPTSDTASVPTNQSNLHIPLYSRPPSLAGMATSNYANLSFLHGPRSCIGEKFARGELLALVAAWFYVFETGLEDPEGYVLRHTGGLTSKPRDGLRVLVKAVEE